MFLFWNEELNSLTKSKLNSIFLELNNGFNCLKLKVGSLEFESEINLLKNLRKEFSKKDLEIRLDANGAFSNETALEKLKRLSDFSIHSIEQPIKPKQFSEMAKICELSPLPIALDEELIGVNLSSEREKLLDTIKPHFLILKPSLLGGFKDSNEWVYFAEKRNIKWWATSALESNVGLNAIAQWVSTKENNLRQGLGTGMLFSNNIFSYAILEKFLFSSWKLLFSVIFFAKDFSEIEIPKSIISKSSILIEISFDKTSSMDPFSTLSLIYSLSKSNIIWIFNFYRCHPIKQL